MTPPAEASFFGAQFRMPVATSPVTTAADEPRNMSTTSEERQIYEDIFYAFVPRTANALSDLTSRAGLGPFIETQADAYVSLAEALIHPVEIYAPHLSCAFFKTFFAGSPLRQNDTTEPLDWEFSIGPRPKRPSGTLNVTLRFAGRGKPLPFDDPWDE